MIIRVYGIVQGVGFRPFVSRLAHSKDYKGFVRNRGSYVEIYLHGVSRGVAEEFAEDIKRKAPPNAIIEDIDIIETTVTDTVVSDDFVIIKSRDDIRTSAYPPDIALCNECIRDIFEIGNRRYLYPFTNCTNCGARFSVIYNLPYDRAKTAMAPFNMCPLCIEEYESLENRRYDAQTISCPKCGPEIMLYNRDREVIARGLNAMERTAKAIDNGEYVVIKSWGGMHIAVKIERAKEFRKWYKRGDKPFAVMVRNIEVAKRFGKVRKMEEKALLSPQRPIVLIDKSSDTNEVIEAIAPKLPNLGIFLPYTAIHHILFHYLKSDAVIMTSANVPGKPMIIRNEDAFSLDLDYYLLHNRNIVCRIDDSLLRINHGHHNYIRRSRGYIPLYIPLRYPLPIPAIAVGSELNNVGAVAFDRKLYTTQYIGDCDDADTLRYLNEAIKHLITIFGLRKIGYVGCDMHPSYNSKLLAKELCNEFSAERLEIQHHHAHALSLMLEHKLESCVCLTLDGVGYGVDGTIWGGEVLYCEGNKFTRYGALYPVPMPGGDMAAKDAARMLLSFGLLVGDSTVVEGYFTPKELTVLEKLHKRAIKTSSMGRFLDAISLLLDDNRWRTYEGECAMKLERLLLTPTTEHQIRVNIIEDRDMKYVYTPEVFKHLFKIIKKPKNLTVRGRAALAKGAVKAVVKGLVDIAYDSALEYGTRNIGLSGGVAYNRYITGIFIKTVKERGLVPYIHNIIPPGDGGISSGQIAYISIGLKERAE